MIFKMQVIDGIGLNTWESSLESLAPRGIFVTFGNASGPVPAYPPLRHIAKSTFMTRSVGWGPKQCFRVLTGDIFTIADL